ncbi:MAG TPA: hypothetical protein VJQ59_11210 [Candidatus Sulfotelmatobacter sp.]|nr:hypothetical protein [Candidatus Sulfotelmatobacter sp.]
MRIQRAIVGVSLLAVITIGLCGCPLDEGGHNELNPPPATQHGFVVARADGAPN